jgi:heptaprenyl diphosphate synthase
VGANNPLLDLPGMADHAAEVERQLRAAVSADDALMAEMAGHLVLAGGKRVRPLLAVAAAATGAPITLEVVLGGVSVELVQVGSLCHDDVIDEAETRRGVESVNARWGNLKAILTGDYLLAKASEIAAGLGTEVAGLLAATIGRLCEGEVQELRRAFDVTRTEDDYLASIEGKTASLFAAATRIGAIVGGLPRDRVEALTAFGLRYGMAFQIVDDILDVVASDEELGKPSGHDMAEGVYTLPVIRTLASPDGAQLRPLLGGPLADAELEKARDIVRANGSVDESLALARSYVGGAVDALGAVGESPAATALADAARHLLEAART